MVPWILKELKPGVALIDRTVFFLGLMRARHAHRFADLGYGISSFLSKGSREISFFSRAISMVFFKISF